MKALILAGGKGSRLRPLTNTIAKHLLPVANKPILFHILEKIKEAGINDIGVVISPENGEALKLALADGSKWGTKITYILQPQPLGIAHAVQTAQDYLGISPFLLFLGDNLIKDGVKSLLDDFNLYAPDALIVLREVADPRAFGVAEVDSSGKVIKVVEKPKEPKSNLALVGVYIFSPVVHQAIAQLKPSWRGEYEITDAIQKLMDMGKEVRSSVLRGWWMDTGKKEDLLAANRVILQEYLKRIVQGDVDSISRIIGEVKLSEGSRVENSLIEGPVSIAANCHVIDSFIGPYTSIGAGARIENSSIENSIILEGVRVSNVPKLVDSLVGRNANITQQAGCVGTSIFVGDYARIEL